MTTQQVPTTSAAERLEAVVTASPVLGPVLERWSSISLPDCWLAAGAVAQTVWNAASSFDPSHGLADIDIVYFDSADLSEASEALHSKRIQSLFSDLSIKIDVKNEARVHLWYSTKFGYSITPYTSGQDAISTFPTTATAIGIRPEHGGLAIAAPFGLSDLMDLIVRPNKKQITREIYEAKVARWCAAWPGLKILNWSDS